VADQTFRKYNPALVGKFGLTASHVILAHSDQTRRFGMDALIDFFTLRPVFTFFGLKLVWYAYLLHTLVQLYVSYAEISQLLAQRNLSLLAWSPNAVPLILGIVAQVAIVRVLLEVAATILLTPKRSGS
jgi:hypothetical protein